ncbi:uncharacterized protein FRV6_01075 [Fusarium oxysporum]|uniref:Dipeptidyl-peptidase V n=2 Tax=Fusarium oxysporum TaxID=5507 RepID=A0A2H3T580_FUSOX|nr:hypothetical protein FOVG_07137 [Fusarium oxysporum f. sp. pisi HDV247]SCO76863.1 uncharacterized protein FRV6_01075 [Fusarium oxysporum]
MTAPGAIRLCSNLSPVIYFQAMAKWQMKPWGSWVMPTAIHNTPEWHASSEYFSKIHSPAFNKISGASDPQPSPCGKYFAFTGSTRRALEGKPISRVCITDGQTLIIIQNLKEESNDHSPKWSPDGKRLAFLSDRHQQGRFAVYQVAWSGIESSAENVERLVEDPQGSLHHLDWSPSGRQLLLLGIETDNASTQDSDQARDFPDKAPSWMPTVRTARWQRRFVSIYDWSSDNLRSCLSNDLTIWEAAWCGEDAIACIVSDEGTENDWYRARLSSLAVVSGYEQKLYIPSVQLGLPTCSPDGDKIAVVVALCSDRGVVAGDILIISRGSGAQQRIRPTETDVTCLKWRDNETLFFTGLNGFHISAGDVEVASAIVHNRWSSKEMCGQIYPVASPLKECGSFCLVLEGWNRYPELCVVEQDHIKPVLSFLHAGSKWQRSQLGSMEERTWKSSDNVEIHGYLYLPASGKAPYPLILSCHGGPVWCFRNRWPGNACIAFLVSQGYAVLTVNERGSSGRGQEFARLVLGDTGGQETCDFLAGVATLVEEGTADPNRLGVTGVSYGGYMAAWLIAQTDIFKASVPVAAVTDWRSYHLESNIALQPQLFMGADPYAEGGLYHQRSPTMAASRIKTPVFQVAGGQDQCVPRSQALQFHQALLEHQVPSALSIYPQEDHGIAKFPAVIDFCARTLLWFNQYLSEN